MPSIAELMATLPEEERFILALHYVKGMDTFEIAKALGVRQQAVNSVIEQGKKRLLQALGALDFPPLL